MLTLALVMTLAACRAAPVSVSQSPDLPPKASVTIAQAATAAAQAKAQVATTATHLENAAAAPTLPEAKAQVSAAQTSNAAAAVSVAAISDALATAAPAATKAEDKLTAAASYDWLRVMLLAAGASAAALLALFTVGCMFASVASSTVLAAIPVFGPLISGARSALYLVMGELVVVIATCAYLAAHIVAAVDFGFAIAAVGAIYLCIRFAIKHHLVAKAGPLLATVVVDVKPSGIWIEHKIAAVWHLLADKFLPAKKN